MPQTVGAQGKPCIEAIITNHNTSALAEVSLLSLVRTACAFDRAELHITVTDNWSSGPAVDRPRRTQMVGAAFTTIRWPHAGRAAAVTVDFAVAGLAAGVRTLEQERMSPFWTVKRSATGRTTSTVAGRSACGPRWWPPVRGTRVARPVGLGAGRGHDPLIDVRRGGPAPAAGRG